MKINPQIQLHQNGELSAWRGDTCVLIDGHLSVKVNQIEIKTIENQYGVGREFYDASKEIEFIPLEIIDTDLQKLRKLVREGVFCSGRIRGVTHNAGAIHMKCNVYFGDFSVNVKEDEPIWLALSVGIDPSPEFAKSTEL